MTCGPAMAWSCTDGRERPRGGFSNARALEHRGRPRGGLAEAQDLEKMKQEAVK